MAPKKNRKGPKNASYYFMLDFKHVRGQAIASLSQEEILEYAHQAYKELTPEERQKYVDMAEMQRVKGEKYTSLGIPISQQTQKEEQKRAQVEAMNKEIQTLVEFLSLDLNELKKRPFYLLHINCLVRTDQGYVVPGEIAIAEFTLETGVQRQYCEFLNIRNIPPGYSCMARDIAEKYHKIPAPPGIPNANRDAMEVYNKVNRFIHGLPLDSELTDYANPNDPPIMFTSVRGIEIISECYGAIIAETGMKSPILVKIYPVEVLYHRLQILCCNLEGVPSERIPRLSNAEAEFEKDKYSYSEFVACQFHDENDERPNCSRTKVITWAYTIAEYACGPLNIRRLPLLHFPQNKLRSQGIYQTLEDAQYEQYQNREAERLARLPARLAGRGRGMNIPMPRPPGASSAPLPGHGRGRGQREDHEGGWRTSGQPGGFGASQRDDGSDDEWEPVPVKIERNEATYEPATVQRPPQILSGPPQPKPSWTAYRENYRPDSSSAVSFDSYGRQSDVDNGYVNEARYVPPEERRVLQNQSTMYKHDFDDAMSFQSGSSHVDFGSSQRPTLADPDVESYMPMAHARRQQFETESLASQPIRSDNLFTSHPDDVTVDRPRRYRDMVTPCPSLMSEQSGSVNYARPPMHPDLSRMHSSPAAAAAAAMGASSRSVTPMSVAPESSSFSTQSVGVNENLLQSFHMRARGRGMAPMLATYTAPGSCYSVPSTLSSIGRGGRPGSVDQRPYFQEDNDRDVTAQFHKMKVNQN